MPFDAIILAGGSQGGALQEYTKVNNQALIPIGEQMMVQYVIDALKGVASINKIAVVGAKQELGPYYENDPNVVLVEQGESHIATLFNGLKALETRPDSKILVATSDIPLLSTEAVEDFLNQCAQKDGDLFYPIVPREINEQRFPGVKRTYVHLKDGVFTGGNLFLVKVSIIEPCAAKAEKLISLRKSPVALCRQIGPMFIIKYLLHRLSLREVEIKFSQLLGIRGYGIISSYPEVSIDVDKPSDLEFVRQILAEASPV